MIDIPYLEGADINDDATLKPYVGKGKPVVMMIQGNFCPHCTVAKPDFVKFAMVTPSVQAVSVQSDGGPTDASAVEKLKSVNTSPGVPAYLGFDKNGRFKAVHQGGRDVASLQQFAQSL